MIVFVILSSKTMETIIPKKLKYNIFGILSSEMKIIHGNQKLFLIYKSNSFFLIHYLLIIFAINDFDVLCLFLLVRLVKHSTKDKFSGNLTIYLCRFSRGFITATFSCFSTLTKYNEFNFTGDNGITKH